MDEHCFTELERLLLDKLVDGDDLAYLRDQLSVACVGVRRLATPYEGRIVPIQGTRAPRLSSQKRSFCLDDVGFQLAGAKHEGRAELRIVDGRIAELKFYNLTGVWPLDPNLVGVFYFATCADGEECISEQRDKEAVKEAMRKGLPGND